MDKTSNKEESVAANSHHVNSSPLPVKHLDFFHEDEIQVPGLKIEEKGGTVDVSHKGQLKNYSFQRVENLMHSVDVMNKSTLDMHIDSSATTRNKCLFKLTTEGTNHPTGVGDNGSCLTKRDLNQLTYSEDKLLTACSNRGKPNKDCTNKFASQEMEANTPTSSVPQKDHSKLSSWLPPELCALYMKKGISELYPWQVECLLVEGVLEKRNLVYCASTRYVETLMGRRRFLSKITAGNSKEKAKAQRQAVNSICQGSAADIIKVAMIKVHSVITNGSMMGATVDSIDVVMQNFSEIKGHCHLIVQVHDELVLEVDPCMVLEAGKLLQAVMENAASLLVPLRAKVKVGKTWGSLEPFYPEP